ncbi:Acetyltransferase (GNAT) family protein [Catalinimonas alkaloidigena]|uniref:Acetyltransferase (GNAT) family protein n=1 Tax=Catalinimonas alkaloidigena TaxID=1075417 RepID=A0A1G9S8M2_9BACT|nr:GNAT family N-acetyltransferase [Catalinimonas alkaloidigena]SDM31809.1 Acetyltransferase (GNAT) family protein [Catalinimonas alkaloidigena]
MQQLFREAHRADLPQLHEVRCSVNENVLSNPARITDQDYEAYLWMRGRGWVCEADGRIVGFAVVDLQAHNVWALFVRPAYAGQGIGKHLHHQMLDWYFRHTTVPLWLSTAPGTRAEAFYRRQGWHDVGRHGAHELKFEMTFEAWQTHRRSPGKPILSQIPTLMANAIIPLMILVAGPYRSGTNDDPTLIEKNVHHMEETALALYRMGHLPVLGEWFALPLIKTAGSTAMGDAIWNELFHPVAIRLIDKCDAILRIGGPSGGADEMVRIGQERGKRILHSLDELTPA